MKLDDRVSLKSLINGVKELNATLPGLPREMLSIPEWTYNPGYIYLDINDPNGKVSLRQYTSPSGSNHLILREIPRKAMHYILIGMMFGQKIIKETFEMDQERKKLETKDEH